MDIQVVEELVTEAISDGCDYFQIMDMIKTRKPLGEDVTEIELNMVLSMIDESKIQRAVLSSEELGDYYNELCRLDWFYEYSDDYSVWKKGSEAYSSARNRCYQNETTYRMWNDFAKSVGSERPKREDYEI